MTTGRRTRGNPVAFVVSLVVIVGALAGVTYYLIEGDASTPAASGADGRGASASPSPTRSTTAAPTTPAAPTAPVDRDPLDIGLRFENQPCDGRFLVMLATAGMEEPDPPQTKLPRVAARYPNAKYLHNRSSCPLAFHHNLPDGEVYQAYLGPFATVEEACRARRRTEPRTWAKRLDAPTVVYCLCLEEPSSLPTLSVGPLDDRNRYRVSDVQQLLDARDLNPGRRIHGGFDDDFREQLMEYQRQSGIPATGRLDGPTWQTAWDDAC